MAETTHPAARARQSYWERYRARFKATWLVCTAINVIGSLVQMGVGDSATLLFSPTLGAAVQWALLIAVQGLWGAAYALPVNLVVAAFPGARRL